MGPPRGCRHRYQVAALRLYQLGVDLSGLAQRRHPDKAKQRLEGLRVVAERRSATELAISTTKSSLGIEYEIRVPRNSSLAIHHRVGFVSISGVTGDIDATCRRGDLVLWLPQKGSYAIDARSKVGTVASDFPGT